MKIINKMVLNLPNHRWFAATFPAFFEFKKEVPKEMKDD